MGEEIISIKTGENKFSLQYLKNSADRIQIYCNGKEIAALDILDNTYISKLFENPENIEDTVGGLENNAAEEQKDIILKIALEKFIEWVKEGNITKYAREH